MKKAIMGNHLGGYYVVNENEVEEHSQRCEQCGDSDYCVYTFNPNDVNELDLDIEIPILEYINEVVENSNFSEEQIKDRLRVEFEHRIKGVNYDKKRV